MIPFAIIAASIHSMTNASLQSSRAAHRRHPKHIDRSSCVPDCDDPMLPGYGLRQGEERTVSVDPQVG